MVRPLHFFELAVVEGQLEESTFAIYTRAADGIEHYGPTKEITIEAMVDYDGDGAFDIVSIEDYWVSPFCFGMTGDERVGVPRCFSTRVPTARFLRRTASPSGFFGNESVWRVA